MITEERSPGLDPLYDVSTLTILSTARAVRTAREYVVRWFTARGYASSLIQDAQLVTSELVTNAYVHANGRQWIHVHLYDSDAGPVIEVWDASPQRPQPGDLTDADAESGRGLATVAALAAAWGVNPVAGGGKAVYAVLAVP
jgi:anti-sigma regulatory factor (Ser/Thr protein kinase)